jgi:2-keto-4-pentenoate hydratase/2-oxohepta-3-ene-1,7-dioic acid hydratase in catechol pathway
MKLVTIDNVAGGVPGAVLESGEILHLGKVARADSLEAWLPTSVRGLLQAGSPGMAVVHALVARVESSSNRDKDLMRKTGCITPATTPLLAPLPLPRLVVAAGLAYRSHLAEMAGTPTPTRPTAFMKSPHSVTAPGAVVQIPTHAAHHVDYEGELAVVFGKRCAGVSKENALEYVAGYCAANDISARDWVQEVWSATSPWEARQTWEVNIMGKQFDGFTPLGPVLLTADEVPDLGALTIQTRLNGKLMQSAPVSDLIFDLPETIAYLSRWYTFEPGDVLLTGTPAGVGVGRKPPVFMQPGDTIEIDIDRIGTLRNTLAMHAPQ